jgi:iron complex outermembrane receptor protein
MKIRYQLAASAVALTICSFSSAAFAQSTGSVDFEDEVIVVSGSRSQDVGGVQIPDTPKSKSVLTEEYIQRQNPGQTVLDTINAIPGVTFTNNDAYGSSGGSLNIRGFGGDRISLTFDGVPLNDTGNYAIYSNQQLDPELIEQVNVNLGSTDVDSPTASAVGGTVNYRTRRPNEDFSVRVGTSAGQFDFKRVFTSVDSGNLNASGSRFYVSASKATNDNPFNNYGKVDKQQYNASFFQPIGENGDFVQVSAHYNQNRNNFFGSVALREDTTGNRVVPNRFPLTTDEREYNINFPCTTLVTARPGLADAATSCGSEFDRRFNPSNTGNVRIKSKFSLTDTLTLTVDPSFQSVKANGGGTVNARERLEGGRTGYIGGRPYFGSDLNGDADLLDEVAILAPSNTRTQRFGVIANLRYDMSDTQSIQVSYTFDRGRHRQTGETCLLNSGGTPEDVFCNEGLKDAAGNVLQKRDRKSIATLHQASGRYNGKFMEEKLLLDIGVRLPFFTRDLTQNCFTTSASGFVDCFGSNTLNASYAASFPTRQGPQNREFNYNKLLPNVGFTYKLVDNVSLFGSYAQGLSVPGTDPLYSSFFFVPGTAGVKPAPETTDSFDGGLRYRSGPVQAMVSGWFTKYNNRLQTVFDVETNVSIFTNIGKVDVYGLDASIAFQPVDFFNVYAFGSLNESEIKDNVKRSATQTVPLAGKKLNDTPNYSFGVGSQVNLGPVSIGGVAKRTGGRYIYDTNLPVYVSAPDYARLGTDSTYTAPAVVFGAKKPAYWLVNLDARVNLEFLGLNDKTFFQLNVYNLFDELYVGSGGGATFQSGSPGFAQIGAPRTVSGTINFQF